MKSYVVEMRSYPLSVLGMWVCPFAVEFSKHVKVIDMIAIRRK